MADNNLQKFKNKNPLQQFLLNSFFKQIQIIFSGLTNKYTVADIGCGEGFTIRMLQKISPESIFTGIDPDEVALAYAKQNDSTSVYQVGDIFRLPFPDNTFDVVFCNEVLEHVKEPEKAVRELARISKKFIICSVPREPLFRISNLLRGRNILRLGNYPFHLNTWSANGFIKFLSQEVSVKKVSTPFPWTLVLAEKHIDA